ncbi:hypothetical protein [Salinisphaera sp. G21_0]|uniref:hypothetical protein n=1 Tax=Salinisphaera sp. G21_0 TaxID=2821094 RepID=UPI001ADA43C8|nr:hypothetical protein [Salinisphaera sp. G21_0]MBO9484525.1 hypothetical protein [Salinisphaera sp. G21_0]
MDKSSITNELTDRLINKTVIAGLFTTYNFEPEFFELDIISELMSPAIPWSTDERVKLFQVREALRKSAIKLDVFYDLPIFRQSADRSPQMEYLCHGVHMGNAAFHAKNIYLLVADNDSGQHTLLMASGSNNITRAGWWHNVEVQHWETIISGEVQRAFLNRIKEDIAWLKGKLSTPDSAGLTLIEDFLSHCRGSNSAQEVDYFSLADLRLKRFLRKRSGKLLEQGNDWSLEIISPYFPENHNSDLHQKLFADFNLREITLFLPRNQEGEALCHEAYFHHINEADSIAWGEWHEDLQKSLAINEQPFRITHSKIFHFYNGKQSRVFVGSVNFTHKATHENIESGYFVQVDRKGTPLLQRVAVETIDNFKVPSDEETGQSATEAATTLPELHISYDWLTKTLTGRTPKECSYEIQFLGAENSPMLSPWLISQKLSHYQHNDEHIESIEALLRNSALVTITVMDVESKTAFEPHRILIQQTGWTHKPLDLPQLSAADILAIYAGMTSEQRERITLNAQEIKLILQNQGGELTHDDQCLVEEQFFCEFAEIFHAFRMLRRRLAAALEQGDIVQVDYYLTGSGLDSIPVLIRQTSKTESDSFSAVTAYLILLCSIEILQYSEFNPRPNVQANLQQYLRQITELKSGDLIQLEDNSEQRRLMFFHWFETQFFKEYKQQTADNTGDNHDAS